MCVNKITALSLNCHGIKSNIPYIQYLTNHFHAIFLSEHWLSNLEDILLHNISQTHHIVFHAAQKHASGRPFGGNCFLLQKTLFSSIEVIHEDEHIFVIKVLIHGTPLILVGLYLTSCRNTESIHEYKSQLNTLSNIFSQHIDEAEFIVYGDFQSFPSNIYDNYNRNHAVRNRLSPLLSSFLSDNNLELVDVTRGKGPVYSYKHASLNHESYIDHIAILQNTSLEIESSGIVERHSLNTSDHLPTFVTINIPTVQKDELNNDQQQRIE